MHSLVHVQDFLNERTFFKHLIVQCCCNWLFLLCCVVNRFHGKILLNIISSPVTLAINKTSETDFYNL